MMEPYVSCSTSEGFRHEDVTVEVKTVDESKQVYLGLPLEFLEIVGEETLLPIMLIQVDDESGMALVELPDEAEGGQRRVWVSSTSLRWLSAVEPKEQT